MILYQQNKCTQRCLIVLLTKMLFTITLIFLALDLLYLFKMLVRLLFIFLCILFLFWFICCWINFHVISGLRNFLSKLIFFYFGIGHWSHLWNHILCFVFVFLSIWWVYIINLAIKLKYSQEFLQFFSL